MSAPIRGRIGYAAGASGTVNLAAGEVLCGVWCVATAGAGSLTIDGGASIILPQNVPFAFALESGRREWVGPIALVFTGTASYFVKKITPS